MLVEEWLVHWLENIARPTLKYNAYRAYRTAVHRHLIPGLGQHRMDHRRLNPEHFERLYLAILKAGGKPGTAHQVYRTARTAFDVDEIRRLIKAALQRRNGVRFVLALAPGHAARRDHRLEVASAQRPDQDLHHRQPAAAPDLGVLL